MRNVERAKQIARAKGITVSFICKQIGKSRGYISEMLTTSRDLPDDMLLPVAQALGVTVEELTGENEKPSTDEGTGLEDNRLLKLYAQLDEQGRNEVIEYIEFKLSKSKGGSNV